jgi:PAS domain-containing protein
MNEICAPLPADPGPAHLRSVLTAPREFVELLPVAAYACDRDGRVLWFNSLAERLWGRAPRIGDLTERSLRVAPPVFRRPRDHPRGDPHGPCARHRRGGQGR